MPDTIISGAILTVGGDFKPGDMPPAGYLDWHEWADVQQRAGLRQKQCGRCGTWGFPQELSEVRDVRELETFRKYKRTTTRIETPVCKACIEGATNGR